jgi:hypothetical protein
MSAAAVSPLSNKPITWWRCGHIQSDVIGLGGEGLGEGVETSENDDLLRFAKALPMYNVVRHGDMFTCGCVGNAFVRSVMKDSA